MGLAEVTSSPRENAADPRRSWVVDLKFIKRYTTPLTLAEIKAEPSNAQFDLVRNNRLSTMLVSPEIAQWLLARLEA